MRTLPMPPRKPWSGFPKPAWTIYLTELSQFSSFPSNITVASLLHWHLQCTILKLLTPHFFPSTIFLCPGRLIAPERSVRYKEVSNLQTQLKGSFSVLGTWSDSWGKDCEGLMSRTAPGFTLFSTLIHQQSYCKQNHQGYLILLPLYTELLLCCW